MKLVTDLLTVTAPVMNLVTNLFVDGHKVVTKLVTNFLMKLVTSLLRVTKSCTATCRELSKL